MTKTTPDPIDDDLRSDGPIGAVEEYEYRHSRPGDVLPDPFRATRDPVRIAILLGSTRPSRVGDQVADWVRRQSLHHDGADFEVIDLRDHPLPFLDEPVPPFFGTYQNEHTKTWARKISSFDGFVIVTPEYNGGISGVLKNAMDYLFAEWHDKAVGFVSYGTGGGTRAAAQLRVLAGELQMASVRQQVVLTFRNDFQTFTEFRPGDHHDVALATLLDQVTSWSAALAPLRGKALA